MVLEKLATVHMLDVVVPPADARERLLVRRTEPSRDVPRLLDYLNLTLLPQPPPRITAPLTLSGRPLAVPARSTNDLPGSNPSIPEVGRRRGTGRRILLTSIFFGGTDRPTQIGATSPE